MNIGMTSGATPGAVSLSLVIPAYNRAGIIHETIDSALGQSQPFAEIIVVDDGSTDGTAAVLARYGERIRLIKVANAGVQAARNTGVAHAASPYIVLCDSDDILEPGFVAAITARLQEHPATDLIYVNFATFDEHGVHTDKLASAPAGYFAGAAQQGDFYDAIPDLYRRNIDFQPFFPTGCVVRRALYEQMGGFDTRFNGVGSEDWEFTLRALGSAAVAVCRLPLARLRRHAGNDSGDSMRQAKGEADILEFALQHHPQAAACREAILASIDARRLSAFDLAFSRASFDVAGELLERLRAPPTNLKFRLKRAIMALPVPLRGPLWRLTQR